MSEKKKKAEKSDKPKRAKKPAKPFLERISQRAERLGIQVAKFKAFYGRTDLDASTMNALESAYNSIAAAIKGLPADYKPARGGGHAGAALAVGSVCTIKEKLRASCDALGEAVAAGAWEIVHVGTKSVLAKSLVSSQITSSFSKRSLVLAEARTVAPAKTANGTVAQATELT